MQIRLLIATPDDASLALLQSVVQAADDLTSFAITIATVQNRPALIQRVDAAIDDVILLDWELAQAATAHLVREILSHNPQMRTVVLLPSHQRQYRQLVWAAGACNSIPKEYVEQEWLSSILCVMVRAMQREARLRAEYENKFAAAVVPDSGQPVL
ncbi:MAG: DNA-binding response regulator [Caldilinea sp. CFX5]|nr:DNA-binding response regulator [Caldilinea sp. CFX5]